jgi:hypothetical protein
MGIFSPQPFFGNKFKQIQQFYVSQLFQILLVVSLVVGVSLFCFEKRNKTTLSKKYLWNLL